MTHIFNGVGKMVPVTVVEAGPVYVTQIKTDAVDGYSAIQVGYGDAKEKQLTLIPKAGSWLLIALLLYKCATQQSMP